MTLPHQKPIRMIESLDYVDADSIQGSITVPEVSPYLLNGELCPEMLVEIMAQSFALSASGASGYLAAISAFEIYGKVMAGDKLRIKCKILRNLGDIWLLNGMVGKTAPEEKLVAEAEFKIFIGEYHE